MSVPTITVDAPLWVARGSVPEQARSAAVLRPIDDGAGGDSDPTVLVLGWRGEEPTSPGPGSLLRVEVTQVTTSQAPGERRGELALDHPFVLVTTMEVGPVPAEGLIAILSEATDHFLERMTAVQGVAFAKSADGRWVVEVLCVSGVEEMRAVQADPEMNAHIAHVAASAAVMDPHLHRLERTITADAA